MCIRDSPQGVSIVDWVLMDISKDDQKLVFDCLMNVIPAIELILSGKTEQAMNQYN